VRIVQQLREAFPFDRKSTEPHKKWRQRAHASTEAPGYFDYWQKNVLREMALMHFNSLPKNPVSVAPVSLGFNQSWACTVEQPCGGVN